MTAVIAHPLRTTRLLALAVALSAANAAIAENPVANGNAAASPASLDFRGMAIQLSSGYKPLETYGPLIKEVAQLGANSVLFAPAGYMEHARSQGLYIDARKTPSSEDLKTLCQQAKQAGLRVILMPIVLLSHPRGSEWRGVIDPPDWDEWWQQYRDFISHFADIAREGQVDVLMVGSELVSTEKYGAEWERVIEEVRRRAPDCKLGYSANWDHYKPVQVWDKLDYIGMTSYYTLADRKSPTVEEIVLHWKPFYEEITRWRENVGKPLILTEVGWCSQEGAATAPWNYYQNMKASPAGLEEQRRLYEAFIRVWNDTPGLGGVIWWEWTNAPGGESDFNYTPRNKPAESILRDWFKERSDRQASAD